MELVDRVFDLDARELQYMEAFLYFGEDANVICEYSFEDSELFLDLLSFGYTVDEARDVLSKTEVYGRDLVLDMILANAQVCLKPLELLDALEYNEDLGTVRKAMRMGLKNPDFLRMVNKDNVMLLIRAKNYGYSAMEINTSDSDEIRHMLINTSILEETSVNKLDDAESLLELLDNNFNENCVVLIKDSDNYSVKLEDCNVEEMIAFNAIDEFIKPIFDVKHLDTGVTPLDNVNFISCTPESSKKKESPEFQYDSDIWKELERWDHYSVGSF